MVMFFVQNSNTKGLHKTESEDLLQSLQRQLAAPVRYIFPFSFITYALCLWSFALGVYFFLQNR